MPRFSDTTMPLARHGAHQGPGLLVICGGTIRRYPLVPGSYVVGRGQHCDICIEDGALSRDHAAVHVERSQILLEDRGSSNGTIFGGRPLPPHERVVLVPGVAAELGEATLLLEHTHLPAGGAAEPCLGASMTEVYRLADRVASSEISVLITGETGAGKGVLARRIHDGSARATKKFLELNCAALPEALLESELFGYERGAFTGAHQTREGLLEACGGGTVFLDEIGELSTATQAKLLFVLEHRKVMRVGGRRAQAIDVRFVSATNQDLATAMSQGFFREDLFYRLNGIVLHVPPLRDRREELTSLIATFLDEAQREHRRPAARLTQKAHDWLCQYSWPGNIRELRTVIHRAVVIAEGELIDRPDLLVGKDGPGQPSKALQPVESERERIVVALDRFAGNQSKAAQHLRMSRTTLSARLDRYGIPRPRKKPQ